MQPQFEAAVSVSCDIVVPVYNGMSHARACLQSVLTDTRRPPGRILVIDDGSDSHTRAELEQIAEINPDVDVLRQDVNQGFLVSANRGIEAGNNDFVCLLNSDTLVPIGWLQRLIDCAVTDDRIASVNPLTNRAAHIDVELPPGETYRSFDQSLSDRGRRVIDIVTGVGFCMLLRRRALGQVGLLDPVYGRGYCEESDLCMRLTTAGWRTVVSSNVFVWHQGGGSFRDRESRYRDNRQIFDRRWSSEYRQQYRRFKRAGELAELRRGLSPKRTVSWQKLAWTVGRAVRDGVSYREPLTALRSVRQMLSERQLWTRALQSKSPALPASGDRPRVTYLLPKVLVAGGVRSVLQLVNGLIGRGWHANVASLFVDPLVEAWVPSHHGLLEYANVDQLCREIPTSDVVVATHWSTVDWALRCLQQGRARRIVYFVQDFEPWFERDALHDRVLQTYRDVPVRIVKSEWLAGKLAAFPGNNHVIRAGMDTDMFYPRQIERTPNSILAMARPGTPYRGFATLLEVLSRVRTRCPDVVVRLFGSEPRSCLMPFAVEHHGVVECGDRLAELYSGSAVFLETSDFHAVGRCSLEALACGARCVATDGGAAAEYLKGSGALLRAPTDVEGLASAVVESLAMCNDGVPLSTPGVRHARQFGLMAELDHTDVLLRSLLDESA